jgi:hypothetical protein
VRSAASAADAASVVASAGAAAASEELRTAKAASPTRETREQPRRRLYFSQLEENRKRARSWQILDQPHQLELDRKAARPDRRTIRQSLGFRGDAGSCASGRMG